ncbi:MAG: hypothetical protein PHO02_05675 [Candidatus Nanoarchaeia archaeon]|nr:hypothetical protein [Candidatus Nanoarchaeia archaeon]
MAPENVSIKDYHSRLNALYETFDNILHPMPKRQLKKVQEDKFVLDPDFALPIDAIEDDNGQIFRFKGCIYFEKLNEKEQSAVKEALINYAQNDNFLALAPRFCKQHKKCQGHHHLENIIANSVPENLAYSYVYFFA